MEALICANAGGGSLPLRRSRAAPYATALPAPVSVLRSRRGLLPRGLRCAGVGWPEPSFVAVAEKPDAAAAAARKARASAPGGGSEEEEDGLFGEVNGAEGNAVEESAVVPPFEQSLVAVNILGDDALSSKLNFKEVSTYVIYGSGAFLAGWILSAVVSAIDSIPLLSKILEIVGFGYIIWFSTRYLLFKDNRDELFVKVDDLKRRIIGYGDE
ncbi:hypothetical protein GUJ93_ZPchr0006g43924 [Zizania palustris]|uniref:Cyanobacterial aminoacyl-tRNA synthetase CAAD domain-containing protein n=1 Tax=Zizania palustris TaxID=103762 RepID=A0A8J5SNA6_ZIZPA|nr:hypothetical protein GUJ93_ZPchr0006g43924 [Zizania palustris]